VGYPDLAGKVFFLHHGQLTVPSLPEIVVARISGAIKLDAIKPDPAWESATAISFCSDWQGRNPDPERSTQVKALWTWEILFLRFDCRFRDLNLFEDSDPGGRRDHLWDRDVAEAFLQPDPSRAHYYREFEVSPNGMWIDLKVFPGGIANLNSGLQHSMALDQKTHSWAAELAIPMKALTARFDPKSLWRANFYRVEGKTEPRAYMAWQPTDTPKPNFHVPGAFGGMRFAE